MLGGFAHRWLGWKARLSDPGPRPKGQWVVAVPCRSCPGPVPLALVPPLPGTLPGSLPGTLLGCSWLPPVTLWDCLCRQCPETGCVGTNLSALGRGSSASWHRYSQCLAVYHMDSTVLHGPGTKDAQDNSGELPPSSGQDLPCLGDPHPCWGSVTAPITLLNKPLLGVLSCSHQLVLKCFFPDRAGNSLTSNLFPLTGIIFK